MRLPRRLPIAIFLIALSTLTLELALTRAFDVILTPQLAYMVITCVMFAFGLAGVYSTLRPPSSDIAVDRLLSRLAAVFGGATLIILPALNLLPFDHLRVLREPVTQVFAFLGMYLILVAPFFISGLIFTTVFSLYSRHIQSLYFWDLTGAAVGCIIIVPLIAPIGPGGLVFCASALALFGSALCSARSRWSLLTAGMGALVLFAPFAHAPEYYDFRVHTAKAYSGTGRVELTRWDSVSKIDVINIETRDPITGAIQPVPGRKDVAYDGGSQHTHIYSFGGDYQALRASLDDQSEHVLDHFWTRGLLASHYLKRDSQQRVLIIGSAGGQETKAALLYGAARVDGVEMVKAVVDLGTGRYAEYNGGIFNHPNVTVHVGEGRSFLRASSETYDIIQIFSNHTSSSIAAGDGAMSPVYLQTADAYREYFEHLAANGVLHINHYVYPRMITTAALAWKQMGRTDFQRHVLVFERSAGLDELPTFLVKMEPWTDTEVSELRGFFASIREGETPFALVQNPLNARESVLPAVFFSGDLPADLVRSMDFRIEPSTDNRPYFNFFRKQWGEVQPSAEKFTGVGTTSTLNLSLVRGLIPMDVIHLVVTSVVSLVFAGLFILVPLYFSNVGTATWDHKYTSMCYFSCLGAGFIILELVFIQVFMKLVGFPVYTYSVVIFAMLCSAGLGSLAAAKLGITPARRWTWPFVGVLITGSLLAMTYPYVFGQFLASPILVRVAVAALLVLPVGFFLGMPFPLGILAIEQQPRGAIAWAWGLNGLFTVVGGLASVICAIFLGFTTVLFIALTIYLVAFVVFAKMRTATIPVKDAISSPAETLELATTP